MFNSKNTKRSLLMSALALVLCVSMLVGSTFAWFTDTASTSVNRIQSGTLDIELLMYDGANWVSAEGETLNFIAADGNQNILWEPGCTYELPALKVVNKGNLELKYQIHITGIEGDAKLLEVIDFTIEGEDSLNGTLAPNAETPAITLIGHMAEEAGNEYQGKTMDAISITVVATQLNAENDTYGPDYDEDAWHPAMKVYNAGDLQAAINNGETNIILMDDIDLTESIVIPAAAATYSLRAAANAVTINLNGKTINNPNGYVFESQGNLILEGNGTVSGLGGIRAKAGSVTINGGNYYASSKYQEGNFQHTLRAENTIVTINGGNFDATVNGQSNAMFNAASGAVITINGGNFKNVSGALATFDPYLFNYEKDGKVIINDGTFYGGWRFNGETATTEIYGGNFTVGYDGQSFHANSTHTVTVYGGSFTAGAKLTDKLVDLLAEGYAAENENGVYTVVFPQESFENLLDGAVAGDTVEIPAGNFTFPTNLEAGVTLNCAPGTVFEGSTALSNGVNVNGATFSNPSGTAVTSTVNGTFTDCTFTGSNGLRWCYAGDTVVFENCVFDGDVYGVHFDGGANNVKFINCTFSGFNAMGGAITQLTMEGCTFVSNGRSNYNGINLWGSTTMTDCTFVFDGTAGYEWVDACGDNKTYIFEGCVVTDGVSEKGIETVVGNYGAGNTVIVNGEELIYTAEDLHAAMTAGKQIVLAGDLSVEGTVKTINGQTEAYGNKVGVAQYGGELDGKGYTLTGATSGSYLIVTHGGVIKNVTLEGTGHGRGIVIYAPTEDVIIDNVVIDGPGYAINTAEHNGQNLIVTNSTLNGWTSLAGLNSVSFTDCLFGENSTKCWQNMGYDQDYDRLIRPYGAAVFTDCTFVQGFYIDLSVLAADATITLDGCACNGVIITAENYADYITVELPAGRTLADCINFG